MLWRWVQAIRADRRRTLAAAGVTVSCLILAVVLVSSTILGDRPTSSAGASPPTSGSPSATMPAGEWAPLELPEYEPVADLVPEDVDSTGINAGTTFSFRSYTSVPAIELAAGLRTEPQVALAVEAGPSEDMAVVRPATPLAQGARYRFRLLSPEGALLAQWTYRTGGPLNVVRVLPADHAMQVPIDTGIEIEFDQDGFVDVDPHVSIEPAVAGRSEIHGRTWAFVPDSPLAPSTLYTVSLSAGVGMSGSEQVLASDVRFQFETAGGRQQPDEPMVAFARPVIELRPGEAPVIPVQVHSFSESPETFTRRVDLYQLPTLADVVEAASTLQTDLGWARWSSEGSVPTAELPAPEGLQATIVQDPYARNMTLPDGLAEGWYLLQLVQEGRDAQAILQVTDVAAFALSSRTRTVAWINDLASAAPVADATVSLATGSVLGRTDAGGLLNIPTPDALLRSPQSSDPAPVLVVSAPDGRRLIAPLGDGSPYWPTAGAGDDWWLLLGTDRDQYRQDDTIHAWGLVRARDDRSVPSGVELRLVAGYGSAGPPIETVPVSPTVRGSFIADVPVRRLPLGTYTLGLFVGDRSVAETMILVTEIRKPAFEVEVTTDRHVYLAGDTVKASATVRFYDGTPAPGMALRIQSSAVREAAERVVEVGGSGAAEMTFTATTGAPGLDYGSLSASPAQPEEGWSSGSAAFRVFPSKAWLSAEAELVDGSLNLTGRLTNVDFERLERELGGSEGALDDPSGSPIRGGRVTVRVERQRLVSRQVGTTYDFLLKKVVPRLTYDTVSEDMGTHLVTSGVDGSFSLATPAATGSGGYLLTLSAQDDGGRQIRTVVWAARRQGQPTSSSYPYLETPSFCGGAPSVFAAPGETVSVTMRDANGEPSADGRTLFVVGQRGVEEVLVTTEAGIERTFAEADLPSLTVRAVRATPAGYVETSDAWIRVRRADMDIRVAIEPDRSRYAPGEEATVAITTTGPGGAPMAADVVVQAVDMKLYAIGAAKEIDTGPLLRPVSSGFLGSYASHRVPPPPTDSGCGATSGGGDARENFEDVATFQLVSTDGRGRATATFELPDDLTSWGLSATAMGDGLESGTTLVEIPAGLPLFVDATIAAEYLVGDQPTIRVAAFGDALSSGDDVRFTVSAPGLGMNERTLDGQAFEATRLQLPKLPLGEHELRIAVEFRGANGNLRDAVVRTVRVVPTRMRTLQTTYEPMTDRYVPPGGDALTTYVVTDAGRGSLLPVLNELAWGASARFDASLAAELARQLLVDEFGIAESRLPPSGFDPARASEAGISVVAYGSPDLFLTARAALVAPERLLAQSQREALRSWADEAAASRERRIVALAGLAGLGDDVLDELHVAGTGDLTIQEQVWLALGYLAAGNVEEARAIERSVLTEHGRRLGPWVRLEIPGSDLARREASASMLLLAAGLGDPVAADLSRYLRDNPSREHIAPFEQLGYIRSALDWLPRQDARFAWTLDGERHTEDVEPGGSFTLALTADQRRSLQFEPLDGQLVVASTWSGEAAYDSLPHDPLLSVKRTVNPRTDAPSDRLVHITLEVEIGAGAPAGCYQVTDLLPSGLAPVVSPRYAGGESSILAPYEVEGQRVSWCIDRETADDWTLGYSARVVSAGTYRWEPVLVQSITAPSVGTASRVMEFSIR